MSRRSGGSRRLARPATSRRPAVHVDVRALMSPALAPALIPVLLVLVVLAASLIARGKPTPSADVPNVATAVRLSRTLSCTQDARGIAARVGTVPASPVGHGAQGGRVTFSPEAAASGYATQWTSGKGWFAARACPEPADEWWFVGAGAGISHRSYLTLDNPRANPANVTITVFGPHGQIDAPGLSGLLVPAGQSLRLDLENIAPALGDVSVHVSADRGLVSASMWEKWAQSPTSASVYSWVPAAPSPSHAVRLVGVPTGLTHATLLVTNPTPVSAVVNLKVANASGTFAPAKDATLTIPSTSTMAVPIDGLLRVGIGSVELSSTTPITAALRSIRGSAEAYAAPGLELGSEATLGLPTGVAARLSLSAPTTTQVQVTALDAKGRVVMDQTLAIPAQQTLSWALPRTAVAVRITGDRHNTVSGAITLDNSAIAVIGLVPTASAAYVPTVVARPY